jgi:hypothetical protein
MTRASAVMNVSAGARGSVVLHEGSGENEHNLVTFVTIDLFHLIPQLPFHQNSTLACLSVLEQYAPL